MDNLMNKFKNTRLLSIIGVCGLYIGVLFSYITINFYFDDFSFTLINYIEGQIVFVLTTLIGLYLFSDYAEKYIPKLYETSIGKKAKEITNPKALLVPVGIIVLTALYCFDRLSVTLEYGEKGLGFYGLWIGVIALVMHTFLYNHNLLTNNNSIDSNSSANDNIDPTNNDNLK